MAFTLIELLLATAIFSIVLLAINTVFFSALRLRGAVARSVEKAAPLRQAFGLMRKDLQMAVPPSGMLVGNFRVGTVGVNSGAGQGNGIEFYTASGRIRDTEPWGDVQQVIYVLRDPPNRTTALGRDLYRCVNRNVATTTAQQPEDQWVLGDVEEMQIECYSGTDWRTTWDTSVTDTNVPVAVRVKLYLASQTGSRSSRDRAPYELLVPLPVQQPFVQATEETQEEAVP